MSRLRMCSRGLLAGVLLASAVARAEASVHGQVSALAVDGRLDGGDFATRLNLGLSARAQPQARGWWVGADVSLLVTPSMRLSDNSSALLVGYRPWSWGEGEEVALTVYPLSASRLRLGWAYPVSWAGRPTSFERDVDGGVQALRLGVERQRWSAYVALKSRAGVNPLTSDALRTVSPLAGASVAVLPSLRVEVEGGLLDRGLQPGLAEVGVRAPARAVGLSARLAYQVGAPIGTSVDFGLYRTAPELYEAFLQPQADVPGLSTSVSLEATRVVQTLEDPDTFGAVRAEAGDALALQVRVKRDALRLHLLAHGRTVPFVLLPSGGFPPARALPAETPQSAERVLTLGADYHFASLGITPGLVLRAGLPAAFQGASFLGGNVPGQSERRWLVFGEALTGNPQYVVLPTGVAPGAVLTARASLKWDVVQQVAAVGELAYTRDPNRVAYRDSMSGEAVPVQLPADVVGFNLLLQLRL